MFSVVIPNYNHGQFLRQRIDSILHQTHSTFELIILDDCSTDDSREIIESYRGHDKISHIIYNEKNSGSPFKQWKKGIELAKGDWIWMAESDDYADTSFLQSAAEAIIQYPSLGMFYTDSYIVEHDKNAAALYSKIKNDLFHTNKWNTSYLGKGIDELNECLKFSCTINNVSSLIFKKSTALNLLNELQKFTFHGDWYFYIRMSLLSDIYYLNKPLNYYTDNEKSHLNSGLKVAPSKAELFTILNFLYSCQSVSEKDKVVDFFSFRYLSFGILQDGVSKGFYILKSYWKQNKKLAWKVFLNFLKIKLLRKKPTGYTS